MVNNKQFTIGRCIGTPKCQPTALIEDLSIEIMMLLNKFMGGSFPAVSPILTRVLKLINSLFQLT